MNVHAFDRMAAIVGAFAKHMNNVSVPQPTVDGEFELIFRQMNNCTLMSEGGELYWLVNALERAKFIVLLQIYSQPRVL